MSSIDEIKARIDVVDLVSESVQLRKAGKNYTGFCPFHPNTRTPAFVVFPDSGTWRCFGQCNEGGDIFKFVMKKEGWDFPQTLHYLAEKAGVVLEPLTPQRQAEEEEHEKLHVLLEEAVTFYRYHLTETRPGQAALAYLQKRGLTPATIERFGMGYAPDAWDSATRHFQDKGYTQDDLIQAGLVSERDSGGVYPARSGVYDRFRNRITIPIRDASGKMAGFGARILNPEDQPKFLNSPQTELFDKGRLLYGLDMARKAIRTEDQVVIVEGYLDVIALHQAGFSNTVSPMGTALTEDQMRMLKRFTRRIVLALAPDPAGQKATLRGLEIARQTMDQTTEVAFDARGLIRRESRLQADLRVTTLPDGLDPDEVALRDPEEWARIVAAAKPVVVHVMETLAAGSDLEDAKVKSEIAAQVLPLINDVANPIEREDYRQRLARLLHVDERALVGVQSGGTLGGTGRRRPAMRRAEKVEPGLTVTVKPGRNLEAHMLRLLLRQPESLYALDRFLQQAGLNRFSVQDFEEADHQLLARLIQQSLEQDALEATHFLAENTPDTLQAVVHTYLEPITGGEPTAQQAVEDLAYTLLRLRENRVRENLDQLRYLGQDLQEQADMRANLDEMTLQFTGTLNRLLKALKMPFAPPK
ncbi:MAG TPA: DNA primase [Anaerolinea sp.]|nr:DNA primase [Anaerolinea sp.]